MPARRSPLVILALLAAAPLAAQAPTWSVQGDEVDVYLRARQDLGALDARPWSLRETTGCVAGAGRAGLPAAWESRVTCDTIARTVRVAPLQLRAVMNTSRPFALHHGPTWAGVGATAEVRAGVAASWGPVSARVAPVAFWAQNAAFGGSVARRASPIDLPDRFGDDAYARVDPGESEVRLTLFGATAGFSTSTEVWGPARTHALIVGPHAGGVPRLFVGTAAPVDIGIGRVHGRLVLGRPGQSEYTDIPADSARRLVAGVVAVFQPRFLDGLELGASRFFHRLRSGGIEPADLLIPFEGLLKSRLRDKDDPTKTPADNQLASLFFRWATRGGFEAYGEFARDDHNADLRDLAVEPDHISAYLVGLQRSWRRGAGVSVLTAELVNGQPTHLARVRAQDAFYVHSIVRQGHTNRGLALGSPALPGGVGALVAVDRYTDGGRVGIRWDRLARVLSTGEVVTDASEVMNALTAEVVRWRGAHELWMAAGPMLLTRRDGHSLGAHIRAGARIDLGVLAP